MSNSLDQIEQLKELYSEYAKTVQEMTEQKFYRGQSVIADLLLEMKEIEDTMAGLQAFDGRMKREKSAALKNYDYLLQQAEEFN